MIDSQDRIALGKTDIMISPMGIGTWAWGDRIYWGYGRNYSEPEVRTAFETSLNAGINFFDTAEIYGQGHSERILGQFIREMSSSEDVNLIIATKFYPYPWRIWSKSLKFAIEGSLKRLQIDSIDLYQIHYPYPPVSIETWASALADTVEDGLARTVGVSNYNSSQMRRAHTVLVKRNVLLASNQVNYSLLNRKIEKNGLLKLCHELGVSCIAYSPLAQGALTGKYSPQKPLSGIRGRIYSAKLLSQAEPLLRLMREIGRAHDGKTLSQVALNWVICKGAIPIPGVKNHQQTQENIGALGWRLRVDEVLALDQASDRLG